VKRTSLQLIPALGALCLIVFLAFTVATAQTCSDFTSDLSAAGTTIAGGTAYPGQDAVNAFDNTAGTYASLYTSATTFVGQDFGATPREIRRVRARGTASYGLHAKLQYSDTGTTWADTNVVTSVAPGNTTWVDYDVNPYGAHRYWRLLDLGGYALLQIDELELLGCGTLCGNGQIDPGEECDGGLCCTPSCTVAATGTVCRAANGTCDVAETCSGTSATCPADVFRPAGTVCRPAVVPCDNPEICSGNSAACPADAPVAFSANVTSTAATIVGGSVQSGYPPTNAFDGNANTLVSIQSSPATYVGQDFGVSGKRIRSVRVYRGALGSYQLSAKLQYSDDATLWSDTNTNSINLPVGDVDWHTYDVDDYGVHRYWRLLDTGGGTGYFQVQEIEMFTTGFCSRELHQLSLVILAHDHQFARTDFDDMHTGGVTAKTLKLTTDSIDWDRATRTRYSVPGLQGWTQRWLGYEAAVSAIEADPTANVMIVRNPSDITTAKTLGKVAAILASEGAMHLEGDLARVQQFYDLGWRETQLSWAGTPNQLTDGVHLTDFGRQVIAEANRLGILIDISHYSGTLFDEILAAVQWPVIRSHDTPSVFGGESTDDMIRAVANSGGGFGIFALHFNDGYLGGPTATVQTLVNAIDYVVNLVGIDHVALGGDYFPENGQRWVIPNVNHIQELTIALLAHGYSCEQVQKILGLNLLRLYERVWGGSH
jgi:membrane dipeptidase